ncbi:CinA family protein [Pedobacter kyonggii]|uniref:CinA family protein n=1 Tax=Pedobacter kyonggii TaxID=1926871 RepID=UPI001FC8F834|nr:CinA family protein [Pedobacter kyonggii]
MGTTVNRINRVGKMLIAQQLTIAFAERATAGRLTAEFSMAEDAGDFLKGGIACYDAILKEDLLKVAHSLIKEFTPESMEVTKAITLGLSQIIPASIHIGITGLTCPGGSETPEKPVGTMSIYACKHGNHLFSERINFPVHRKKSCLQRLRGVPNCLKSTLHP